MKWNFNYIQKNAKPCFTFEEEINFDEDLINKLNGVYGLKNLIVNGKLKYIEAIGQCIIDYEVSGIMNMKCAITNEPLEYKFNDCDTLSFKFIDSDDDEIILAKGNVIDLIPYVWQLIVVNVPLKVVKEGAKLKNISGKNWKVGINNDENPNENATIDPRLESLKNYFDKH